MRRLFWLLVLLPGLALAQGGGVSALAFNVVGPVSGQVLTYNGKVWVNGSGGTGTLPSCTVGQLVYYATTGSNVLCLTLGTNLSITGGVLNAAGGGAVSSVTGSGLVACSPTTGSVVCSGASQSADTILMNATGGSAQPTAVASSATVIADLQATTTFTVAGTGCTPSAHTGGPFSGTVTLAPGPCTAITITMNGGSGFTAPNGYHCNVGDKTLQAAGTWFGEWPEHSSTTTTATLDIPSAAGATDVISFDCEYY